MRILYVTTVLCLTGFVSGAIAAWLQTDSVSQIPGSGPHPWVAHSKVGGSEATPYQRAIVARTGIWALPTDEVVYFVTETDNDGEALRNNCRYRLSASQEPDARWWSINAYENYFWIDNPLDRYSFSKTTVTKNTEGGYIIDASPSQEGVNWLPLSNTSGKLTFLFRLYQPSDDIQKDLMNAVLPEIERLTCKS